MEHLDDLENPVLVRTISGAAGLSFETKSVLLDDPDSCGLADSHIETTSVAVPFVLLDSAVMAVFLDCSTGSLSIC